MAASKLTLAQERLVICTKTGRKDGSSSPQVSLEVLIQSGHFALDRIADICGPTGLSAYPMLLDEPDFETMQEREFDVESAVAIHNFGLAYLCLSHVTKKKATAHKLRESARKLMHMSLSILKMKMRQESIIDETHYCQLLITQAVVLTSYIPLLNEIDDFDEAQAQYDRLIDVRDLLLDIVGPLEALCPTKRAAPAA